MLTTLDVVAGETGATMTGVEQGGLLRRSGDLGIVDDDDDSGDGPKHWKT